MSDYQDNLRYVAEPQTPSDRDKVVSTTVEDFEALWFSDGLREFAHYGDHDDEDQSGIAMAYASYIDNKVREQGQSHVTLYVHERLAAETLMEALDYYIPDLGSGEDYPTAVFLSLEASFSELLSYYVEEDE